jgi:hypothetical protein
MKTRFYSSILVTTLFALAIAVKVAAAPLHYKLIVIGMLGGPNDQTATGTPALVLLTSAIGG